MRTEPATPPELLALARALFANGNRLARTAMTLEATLDDIATLPAQDQISRFVRHAADALQTIAGDLRAQRTATASPDLRARQRELIGLTRDAENPATAELLVRICDRLVDNIDTLAYVMNRSHPGTPETTDP
jgi:hypothetical protein